MLKNISLEVPQQFEKDLRQEMQAVALEAFKDVASKCSFAEYLKRKDAAQYLGISTGYLDQLTAKGLPTIMLDGLKLYKRSSVDQWMVDHQV
ncbi:DNA-binding protein [Lacticaseibacillus rhamnosus]|jgi:predicted methyltransferase|uniref:hypothetical protein n=1 Tax=Lacticaseibacillus TaxID=2759736 RepID=UPI0007E019E4|nr:MULTISPECIES: hypothetical protein [Lacticaseibacillus]OFR91757.1 hypothetical protein HMPREF2861_12255 [Lactobacillus sp. HMSC068F07]MCT3192756.1 DNA-binding protein [Lacticaseibacillus rhamnosus]MCT3373323.1 DNA-binding protein [Lacticaseibacillus rhamnosus]OAU10048.1 hypothetical protein PY76_11725 [Lacticaseibacillus rhamnosus]OAU18189.1 hypothetical protein PY77_12305 [Lacticaseibacillus rhamnosus]